MRGINRGLLFDEDIARKLLFEKWRWSAHTHPDLQDKFLIASGFPGDREALQRSNKQA